MARNQYSCPLENGVRCLSTREVYAKSHNGQVPKAVEDKRVEKVAKAPREVLKEDSPYQVVKVRDFARPLRTQSQVMRIWIAPWQDKQDDLMISGYIYTEIEPRKWIYGLPSEGGRSLFTPLKKSLSNPIASPK
jgi:conjugal transfer pilus assembly protein TraV